MSGYVCTRCGKSDDQARAEGCARGPCLMAPARRRIAAVAALALANILAPCWWLFAIVSIPLLKLGMWVQDLEHALRQYAKRKP